MLINNMILHQGHTHIRAVHYFNIDILILLFRRWTDFRTWEGFAV